MYIRYSKYQSRTGYSTGKAEANKNHIRDQIMMTFTPDGDRSGSYNERRRRDVRVRVLRAVAADLLYDLKVSARCSLRLRGEEERDCTVVAHCLRKWLALLVDRRLLARRGVRGYDDVYS